MTQAVSNVTRLPVKAKQHRRIARKSKALRPQQAVAVAVGTVGATLTALSLNHLAHGITLVTGAAPWEAWSLGVGIDCGFLTVEMAQITIGERVRRQIAKFSKPAIVGMLSVQPCSMRSALPCKPAISG
jgi:hypothetical protein